VHVWSLAEGAVAASYECPGSVFEVGWSRDGRRLAASLGDKSVVVLDLRR